MTGRRLSVPPEELRQAAPVFGDWLPLARLDGWVGLRATPDPDVAERVSAPWRPPEPMRPFALVELFTPGTRLELPEGVGTADPYQLSAGLAPFAAAVAPGVYPVELAKVRFGDGVGVAAAKVTISQEPVVSWQLALRPGQDTALLGDGEFHGFRVDTGLAGLVDVDAVPAFEARLKDGEDPFDEPEDDLIHTPKPVSGANVIAFSSGWGDGAYPTWVGLAEDGAVAAFVVDLLVVRGGEILP